LSDENLRKDDFFRDLINSDQQGWVDISHLLNCWKIKQQKSIDTKQIALAAFESDHLEVSMD